MSNAKADFEIDGVHFSFSQWEPSPPWCVLSIDSNRGNIEVQTYPENFKLFCKMTAQFLLQVAENVETEQEMMKRKGWATNE